MLVRCILAYARKDFYKNRFISVQIEIIGLLSSNSDTSFVQCYSYAMRCHPALIALVY